MFWQCQRKTNLTSILKLYCIKGKIGAELNSIPVLIEIATLITGKEVMSKRVQQSQLLQKKLSQLINGKGITIETTDKAG